MAVEGGTDIQRELQEYFYSRGINSLFEELAEGILAEEPANPIEFLIRYLKQAYPDLASTQPLKKARFEDIVEQSGASVAGGRIWLLVLPDCLLFSPDSSEEEVSSDEELERKDIEPEGVERPVNQFRRNALSSASQDVVVKVCEMRTSLLISCLVAKQI